MHFYQQPHETLGAWSRPGDDLPFGPSSKLKSRRHSYATAHMGENHTLIIGTGTIVDKVLRGHGSK